jgi:uncharacterized protein YeaO (DUF488 family)
MRHHGALAVRVRRIYDPPGEDGQRVLVDRLWPRGMTRERAALHAWMPALAPSTPLRLWFGHDPERWGEFRRRYRAELRGEAALIETLRAAAARAPVTLLYGARDAEHNHALVLREVLLRSETRTGAGQTPRRRSAKVRAIGG